MKISSINNNSNNFKGLHFKPSRRMKAEDFLRNPVIKKCAEEYEVVIKEKKKLKMGFYQNINFFEFLGTSGVAGAFAGAFINGAKGALLLGSAMIWMSSYAYLLLSLGLAKIPKIFVDKYYHIQSGEGIDKKGNLTGKTSEIVVVKDINNDYVNELNELTDKTKTKPNSCKMSHEEFLSFLSDIADSVCKNENIDWNKVWNILNCNGRADLFGDLYIYSPDINNNVEQSFEKDLKNRDLSQIEHAMNAAQFRFDNIKRLAAECKEKNIPQKSVWASNSVNFYYSNMHYGSLLTHIYKFLLENPDLKDDDFTSKLLSHTYDIKRILDMHKETRVDDMLRRFFVQYYERGLDKKEGRAEIYKYAFEDPNSKYLSDIRNTERRKQILVQINENINPNNVNTLLDLLKDKQVVETKGRILNDNPDILLRIPDIVQTDENREQYQEMLRMLEKLDAVDYNVKDSFGVSFLEKVLNSENTELLKLIKTKRLDYHPELDYVYRQIENPEFKQEADTMTLRFVDIEEGLKIGTINSIDSIEPIFSSPLFNEVSQKDLAKFMTCIKSSAREYFCTKYEKYLPNYYKSMIQLYAENGNK